MSHWLKCKDIQQISIKRTKITLQDCAVLLQFSSLPLLGPCTCIRIIRSPIHVYINFAFHQFKVGSVGNGALRYINYVLFLLGLLIARTQNNSFMK